MEETKKGFSKKKWAVLVLLFVGGWISLILNLSGGNDWFFGIGFISLAMFIVLLDLSTLS